MKDFQEIIKNFNRELMQAVHEHGRFHAGGMAFNIELLFNVGDFAPYHNNPHRHSHYEFSVMTNGTMAYQTGKRKILLSADNGKMVMIPPEHTHFRHTVAVPSNIFGFQLKIEAEEPTALIKLRHLDKTLIENGGEITAPADTRQRLLRLYRVLRGGKPFKYDRAGLMIQDFILSALQNNPGLMQIASCNATTVKHQDYLVLMADRHMEENPGRMVTVAEIASKLGISARHLNRIYTQYHGLSPGRQLIRNKIDAARRLLRHRDRMIKEIADELGFGSVNYFCRQFKQHTGQTPEQFRQDHLTANAR